MNIFQWLLAVLVAAGVVFSAFRLAKVARAWLKKLPRMFEWLLAAVASCALIFLLAPQQLPVSAYKISLIAIAGVMGYWLDRSLFPYARPDSFLGSTAEHDDCALSFELQYEPPNDLLFAVSMVRRAVIVAAAMIAVGLGA
jgi:hypothetical protein